MSRPAAARGLRWTLWSIRAATGGLPIDAYVHPDLAAVYREAGGVISEGVLFRAEAVAGLLAAPSSSPPDGGPYLAGLASRSHTVPHAPKPITASSRTQDDNSEMNTYPAARIQPR